MIGISSKLLTPEIRREFVFVVLFSSDNPEGLPRGHVLAYHSTVGVNGAEARTIDYSFFLQI
jgi:hypothetical protein